MLRLEILTTSRNISFPFPEYVIERDEYSLQLDDSACPCVNAFTKLLFNLSFLII